MDKSARLVGEALRWPFLIIGALLFVYGFGWGRWDAAVGGVFLMQFGIAMSLKLRIMALTEKAAK